MKLKLYEPEYNYNVEQVTGDVYRLYGEGLEVKFTAEFKNGMYFKICSVTRNGKTYSAQRYHYSYISLIREATFEVWKNDGLYDYTNKRFVSYEDGKKILGLQTN